jgi:D-proline reductase (dithiol) PrdB
MARIEDLPDYEQEFLLKFPTPTYETRPWVTGPPLKERKIAAVTTAGLHQRGDRPFSVGVPEYRVIPSDIKADDLVMSHISVNFDRSGYQEDLNIAFPIDRLNELANNGEIGSLASYHYSFMGAAAPDDLEPNARRLANVLKSDGVDSVLLTGV